MHTPLFQGSPTCAEVTETALAPLERRATWRWWVAFGVAFGVFGLGTWLVVHTVRHGLASWGLDQTVGWGFAIASFVFWIGIGHAGTLISAVLLLLRQRWRTSIARSAEAMTLIAVLIAATFPVLHLGRPWLAFWVLPYPSSRDLLVNFRSPLTWDVFAIGTYLTVSLMFFYLGLLPDLATIRDRSSGLRQRIYGWLSLGWSGSARGWHRYERACVILAALATPLVVSVHTVVSYDFATSLVPGWHATLFPPYFVTGALFSGLAMVVTLLVVLRKMHGLEASITPQHLEVLAKVLLATGSLLALVYATEHAMAWLYGSPAERFTFHDRIVGPYAWAFWVTIGCNVVLPQTFWFRRARRSVPWLLVASVLINVGMWVERYEIVTTSLSRGHLPSAWSHYTPTGVELGILAGSFGLFFVCFLLFVRVAPAVGIHELKRALHTSQGEPHG